MAAIITEKFRMSNAKVFKADFASANDKYYMFLGKSSPWSSDDAASASDTAPPTPIDDVTSELHMWDDMIAAKNIASTDVSYVVPRRNWENGEPYDMYEHDISSSNTTTSGATNIYNSTFYFLTSEHKIYKVLDNNGGANYVGTEPTETLNTPFAKGGYVLQYMETINAGDATKFLTSDFMPVGGVEGEIEQGSYTVPHEGNATVAGAAVDGSIVALRVTSRGSDLQTGTFYAAIYGDGTNAGTASGAIVKITVAGGQIATFGVESSDTTVQVAGAGYTYANIPLGVGYTFEDDVTLVTPGTHIGTTGSPAIEAIISPKYGHGVNVPKELGGHYVLVNTTFSNTETQDVTESNDFRRVGLLKSPWLVGTDTAATAATYRTTKAMCIEGASGDYVTDELITGATSGALGKVVEWDSTNKILYYVQERFAGVGTTAATQNFIAFNGADDTGSSEVVNGAGGSTGTPAVPGSNPKDGITFNSLGHAYSELEPDSGDVIYIENRKPITRASDQTEDIKIIVEF